MPYLFLGKITFPGRSRQERTSEAFMVAGVVLTTPVAHGRLDRLLQPQNPQPIRTK
jgi:hypothetical protein